MGWLVVLGHRREEVVLDLEVEVGHPPVDKVAAAGTRGVREGERGRREEAQWAGALFEQLALVSI